jgi:hypothetical protein
MYELYIDGKVEGFQQGQVEGFQQGHAKGFEEGYKAAVATVAVKVVGGKSTDGKEIRIMIVDKVEGSGGEGV